jgi:GH43 family beta-xylosidase
MYLFAYFKDNGQDGLHLAISDDGLHYRALNGDQSLLAPQVGESKLMRDPFLLRGPDNLFHLIWTTSWDGQTIGYSSSQDLIHWSPQHALSVMAHEPTTLNCWAPEMIYDEKLGHFVIFWSSTIPGRFPDTDHTADGKYNHRLYYTHTTDFQHLAPTQLLYDPGFNIIDASYLQHGQHLYLLIKDETRTPARKNLRIAKADSPTGPFGPLSEPFTESWVEGPAALTLAGRHVCFFDCYTRHRYGATAADNLDHPLAARWTDISHQITFPPDARHGSFCQIPNTFGQDLERKLAKPLIEQRADPHIYKHTDGHYYLTATVPEYDRIELRRAKTIQGLATAKPATLWHRKPAGEMGGFIWAPEIHFIDGQWYIYFAAGRAEERFNIRMYAITNHNADPFTGHWQDAGQVKMNFESFTLDSTTFTHRGQRYMAWAQNEISRGPGTSVYIAKMTSPLTLDSQQVILTTPEYEWEKIGHRVNEGPAVLIRHGKVFLTFSASATDHHYCLGLLTADENADLLNPQSWTKSPEPVLKSDESISQYGPGHNSFTVAEDGETDVLVYHARTYKDIQGEPLFDHNRHTFTRVVRWTADGRPVFTG